MKPKEKFLKDYKPLDYFIREVELTFYLDPQKTRVCSKMKVNRNGGAKNLELDGVGLKLVSVFLDGKNFTDYEVKETSLIIKDTPDNFILEIEVEINPQANTVLDGLYLSSHFFCTQNEPEGFRRITYFLDRPDNMAKFTTKIVADPKRYPHLLSNGNLVEKGDDYVVWHDPFLKPCYLFALVAGDFAITEDTFITKSNREIELKIYSEKGDESKCIFAMDALKRSMKWDEETFNLEYDLDVFMIVATNSFNMGAMENKGLNIFNSVAILADKETTTDQGFLYVERVIAHEYFHNWTGNRVTCRDWFQLTLKEGLTIYRDQEFSADMHDRNLKRIEAVLNLQTFQFPEDRGPTSHPIQPASYIEINNFYTKTVYEKGSEIIRMIATLIGQEKFKAGIAQYFELYDSMAVTTEDFIHAMEVASGFDLGQFRRWYAQNGTPEINVKYSYDEKAREMRVDIQQFCKPLVPSLESRPLHFPLRVKLISNTKHEERLLEIKNAKETFVFENVDLDAILSVNRGFSAPIIVHMPYHKRDMLALMKREDDPYNRFQITQDMAQSLMQEQIIRVVEGEKLQIDTSYLHAYLNILQESGLSEGLKAKLLRLPSETELLEKQSVYQFQETHDICDAFSYRIAKDFEHEWKKIYGSIIEGPYVFNTEMVGKRSLKNLSLEFLSYLSHEEIFEILFKRYKTADNMTNRFAALSLITDVESPRREEVLQDFFERYKADPLVMMKWLSVQASSRLDSTFSRVKELIYHPIFDFKVPNLVRSLLGTFIENHAIFHGKAVDTYPFLREQIAFFDEVNPHVSARLASAFKKYPRMPKGLKELMGLEMEKLLKLPLSPNIYEIITKSLYV
jgi:aminopeptidase N